MSKFFVDVYGGVPVSGQVSTEQEYEEALQATPDFCGVWREFDSRKEAEKFIINYNGVEDKSITANKYPCAFQSWDNGGKQKSSTYYSGEFYPDGQSHYESFVEGHNNSDTFATLHICETEEAYDVLYDELFGKETTDTEEVTPITVYGHMESGKLTGWSHTEDTAYNIPIEITYSRYEENTTGDITIGWNIYDSDYGELSEEVEAV